MSKNSARESVTARAAAVRAQQASAERRRRLYIGGAVLFLIQSQRDTTGETAQAPVASDTAVAGGDLRVAAAETYGLGVGDPEAKVKVEIFEDFLCPFCQQYESASRARLRQDAADGKVYVVYRPIAFLNEYSARSLNAFAVVLNTAGPEVALRFHDLLYDHQPSETGEMPSNEWLVEQAVAAGATKAEVADGIDNMTYEQWLLNGADDASKRKVTGTPTVFLDGTPLTGVASIDDLVAKTEEGIDAGQ